MTISGGAVNDRWLLRAIEAILLLSGPQVPASDADEPPPPPQAASSRPQSSAATRPALALSTDHLTALTSPCFATARYQGRS
jgi:hypothetical protein